MAPLDVYICFPVCLQALLPLLTHISLGAVRGEKTCLLEGRGREEQEGEKKAVREEGGTREEKKAVTAATLSLLLSLAP